MLIVHPAVVTLISWHQNANQATSQHLVIIEHLLDASN